MRAPGGRVSRDGASFDFTIDIQPVAIGGEKALLISFVEQPAPEPAAKVAQDNTRLPALQQELEDALTRNRELSRDLSKAWRDSERANHAKTRFLAAASHDLRRPLQTLTLLNGLLTQTVSDAPALKLLSRVEATIAVMATMLDTLLDINQIDAGMVPVSIQRFPLDALLLRLSEEFGHHAQARGLALRVVPSTLNVVTDPGLLEQIIRNLLANALKYTSSGRVLLGCRRRGNVVSIKIMDTGMGIPETELAVIRDEFQQVSNPALERRRGLGLRLSIVQRLGQLLGLQIGVSSAHGKGSVFSIDLPFIAAVKVAPINPPAQPAAAAPPLAGPPLSAPPLSASPLSASSLRRPRILILEENEMLRELLEQCLEGLGYGSHSAADGLIALRLVSSGAINPDLIVADYNLPGALNGLQAAAKLQELQSYKPPVIILSGDSSVQTLQDIAARSFIQLGKPATLADLVEAIETALATVPWRAPRKISKDNTKDEPVVFIVDDDPETREALGAAVEASGRRIQKFASCEAFLASYQAGQLGCLLIDADLPGMPGLELVRMLTEAGSTLPSIMTTKQGNINSAVSAMQAGALNVLEKPINLDALHQTLEQAFHKGKHAAAGVAQTAEAAAKLAGLTARQSQIMHLILAGQLNKNIAADLGISQRTVEKHRSIIMEKTGAKSLPALARLAMAASQID